MKTTGVKMMDHRRIMNAAGRSVTGFLSYNRVELRGVLVLSLILLVLIWVNVMIPGERLQKSPDFTGFFKEVREFEHAWQRAADSDSLARTTRYFRTGTPAPGAPRDSSGSHSGYRKPVLMIELNAADSFDLQQLRGIGPGFARRILGYREKLGGYFDKSQLMEVFGMDSARFHSIEGSVTADPGLIRRMDLNAVTFKELIKHPCFPFAVAKNIMICREKNKGFRSFDELNEVPGVTDSLFRRMVFYLRLSP